MKIVLLGNTELPYSSETYYVKTLRSMKHDVTPLFESVATGEEVLEEALKSDLFVWIHGHSEETSGKPMKEVLLELRDKGITTLTWHHDLFYGLNSRKDEITSAAVYKYIQHFFSTDKLMADWVNEHTYVRGHYLPSAVYDKEAVMLNKKSDGKDVVFVGNKGYHPEWQYRPNLIKWLEETYEDRFGWYSGEEDSLGLKRGWDMNQLFADSKIVVGDTLCLDFKYPYYWSDRLWETLGRGGFLIMPYVKGMEKYVEDGVHLRFYEFGNFKQLKYLIDYYLNNPEERDKIRKQGHEHVKQNHTYHNRWQEVLATIGVDAKEWNGYYGRND